MTQEGTGAGNAAQQAQGEAEQAYRDYIAGLVLSYVSHGNDETSKRSEALQQIMSVTGRSYSTVRNWFNYRSGLPDLESMARIMGHWKLPPDEVFPGAMVEALRIGEGAAADAGVSAALASRDAVALRLSGRNDPTHVRHALQRYSEQPAGLIFLRQEGSDASGVVEHGELMLVDASVERIAASGLYILRIKDASGRGSVVLRGVQLLMGKPAARVGAAGQALSALWEELSLTPEGLFDAEIAVLGRLVAVLRSL